MYKIELSNYNDGISQLPQYIALVDYNLPFPLSTSLPPLQLPPPQNPIDAVGGDIIFHCPDDGYLGGFQSDFISSSYDRQWSPYCCQRPFAALVDCIIPTSGWENDIRDTLNFTAPEGHVIAGMTSFFFNR